MLFTGTKCTDRLYYLDMLCHHTKVANAAAIKDLSKIEQAHHKFGHLNYDLIQSLTRKNMITGLKLSKEDLKVVPPVCTACAMRKMT